MRKIKYLLTAVLSLAILGAGAFFGWQFLQQNNTEPVKVYSFDFVGMTEFWGDTKESYGPVSSDKIQTVFLSDTQTVSEVLVTEGQQVQKGDLLMRFDTTLSQLELERKGLEIQKTTLDLEEAQTRLQEITWMRPMSFPPAEPETEPTEPDYGYMLGYGYQFDFNGGHTGSSIDRAVVCWVRGDTKLDLVEMGKQRERLLNISSPEDKKDPEPTKPTETKPTEPMPTQPQEQPTETIPTEPMPTEDNPIQEQPTEETPTEEIPTEEAPTEETPAITEGETDTDENPWQIPDETFPTEESAIEQVPEVPVEQPTVAEPVVIPEPEPEPVVEEITAEEPGNSGLTGQELLVMYNAEIIEEEPVIPADPVAPTEETEYVEPEEPTLPSEETQPTAPAEETEPTDETEATEGPEPTEATVPTAAPPSANKDKNKKTTIPYYVIIKVTENNMSKGNVITWVGMHVNSDGSFTFFDARGMADYTIPPVEEEEPGPYIDYFGSGYTYTQIQQMKEEQLRKIRDLELQLKVAEAEYKIMERELSDGSIYAELEGKVLSVLTEEEAKLKQQPILKISCGGGFYVEASISELERDGMQIGQEVTVSDWDTGMTYSGVVTSVGDVPTQNSSYNGMDNPNASSYPFIVFVDETADLRAGSYVSVSYSAGSTQNGIYLQKPFLRTVQGRSFVYVLGADGLLEERTVTTGKSLWGSYTEIVDGLTADDLIAFPYGKNVRPGVPAVEGDMNDLYSY